jgi:hypothetical protein
MTATVMIRREILDVEVQGTEADGVALQRRLSDVCADVLGPALEAAFARVDRGDAHLMIERLAIDLADISLDRLDAELTDAVHREVGDYFRRNPPVPAGAVGRAEAGAVQRRSVAETVDEALVVFLRTGRLPWSFRLPPGGGLEQLVVEAWGAAAADRGPPPAVRARLGELLALPTARARLFRQFTPGFVMTVLRGFSPPLATAIEDVVGALDQLQTPAPVRATFAIRVWEQALAAASVDRPLEPAELARSAWRALAPVERDHRPLAQAVERRWPGATNQPSTAPEPDRVEAARPMPSPPAAELDDERDGILVDHAGVVLLHPFLLRFFSGLGVADGDELLDPDRAVGLLHHLATGEMTAPEHQVTVAKVLCGVPLDEPTDADTGLTDADAEEAIALLDAAIGHWGALGDSSPDALRGEFLMRPGILAVDADGDWQLRVEERTVDILLDQLPWGISLVKLPWMDRLLRVEWR